MDWSAVPLYKLSLDARKRASRWNVCGSHGDVHLIYGSASPIIAEQNPVPSIFCVPDAPDRKGTSTFSDRGWISCRFTGQYTTESQKVKRGEGAPSLFIDPLQQRQPLGEKGLGFGVMQPAFAVGAVHQLLRQCGGGSVDSHHVLHGQLQGERRRNIRQRRQRVLPHKGRQQLHRHGQAGALLGQQQCGGGAILLHL